MYDTHDDALAPGAAFSADDSKAAAPDAAHGTRSLDTDDLSDAANAYPPLPSGATAGAVAFSGDGKYVARAAATGSTPDGSRLFAVTTTWPAASSGRTSSGRQRCTTTPGDLTHRPAEDITDTVPCRTRAVLKGVWTGRPGTGSGALPRMGRPSRPFAQGQTRNGG